MIFFSDRKRLEKKYKEWCEKNYATNCVYNVITFLQIKNLLDEEKVKLFLKEGE